jgi:hypothetical protein
MNVVLLVNTYKLGLLFLFVLLGYSMSTTSLRRRLDFQRYENDKEINRQNKGILLNKSEEGKPKKARQKNRNTTITMNLSQMTRTLLQRKVKVTCLQS